MISVAIIGAGPIAEEHIKAFIDIDSVHIAGIYSRTHEKANILAQKYSIPHLALSLSELFEKTKALLVVVAIPIIEVERISRELVKYEWDIFFEKPAGLNYKQCLEIAERINLHKRKVFVGHNRRFFCSTKQIKEDIEKDSGYRFININDYQSINTAKSLGYSREVCENWMYANSIHLIDFFFVFGRSNIKEINVINQAYKNTARTRVAHIIYENGDAGIYQGVWHGPGPWSVSLCTSNAFFEMRPLEIARRKDITSNFFHEYKDSSNKKYKPGFHEQAIEIVKCIQGNENCAVTIQESLKTMKLINSIYKA